MSYISKLFKQLSKSRWIQLYFALVIIQTLLSIPILIKTLLNTGDVTQNTPNVQADSSLNDKDPIFGNYLTAKGYKIIYENILFIAFEIWRLWTLTDGIVHLNALTIIASAWFSVFSSFFNVLLVIESNLWITSQFADLKVENKNLQIALSSTLFFLSVPVIISAYKTAKIIGWQVYKKIGSSIELQNMYQKVQWFALWLKIDIYFEIILLVFTAAVSKRLGFQIICIAMALLVSASLVFSRIAIAKESNWMMLVFLFLQIVLLGCNVYSLIGLFEYSIADLWFTGIIYEFVSSICIIITVYLALRCQINFGKGLKPHVFWIPYQSTKSIIEEPTHYDVEAGLLSIKKRNEDRMPIDDDDDNLHSGSTVNENKIIHALGYESPRTSLERDDKNVPSDVNTKPDPIAQPVRMAMKPVPKKNDPTIMTITINSSELWRSETPSTTGNNYTAIDPGTTAVKVMERVMQPVSNSKTSNPVPTTITTTASTAATTIITKVWP